MSKIREIPRGYGGETFYFKDLIYNTFLGKVFVFGSLLGGAFLTYKVVDTNFIKNKEPVQQIQTIGTERPDIFIERNRVKYFSHVDGKEISDLIR